MQWMHRCNPLRVSSLTLTCALGLIALLAACLAAPVRADESARTPKAQTSITLTLPDLTRPADPVTRSETLRLAEARTPRLLDCAARGRAGAVGTAVGSTIIAIRLGALVSPSTKFDGGIDVTVPSLRVIPGWLSRFDLDFIIDANFGGISTLIPLTFDQIYSKTSNGTSFYLGGGIGAYFSDDTRFGGKIIAGVNFSSRIGAELNVHFTGLGDALVTLQARIPLR